MRRPILNQESEDINICDVRWCRISSVNRSSLRVTEACKACRQRHWPEKNSPGRPSQGFALLWGVAWNAQRVEIVEFLVAFCIGRFGN